jgi:hypothetical protein
MANKLLVELGADTSDFRGQMGQLEREGTSRFQSLATSIKGAFANLGGIIGAGTFLALSKGAMDLAAHLRDMALNIGINVEKLQVLKLLAQQNGVEEDKLGRAMEKMNLAAIHATQGGKEEALAFQQLGINTRAFLAMPMELKMQTIAQAYARATDKNLAYNAVVQIFGERQGPQMMAMLNELATKGFPALESAARKSGEVMSAETVAALNKAERAIDAFRQRITIAVGNIIVNFRTEEGMKLLLYRFLELAGAFGGKIADAIFQGVDLVGSVLKGAFVGVAHVFQDTIVNAVERAAAALNKILPKKLEINIANLDQFKSDGKYVADSIADAIAKTKPTNFSAEFSGYWKKLGDQQQSLVNQINKVDLGKPAAQLRDAGKLLQASAVAADQALKDGAGALAGAASKLVSAFDGISKISKGAMQQLGGLAHYTNPEDQRRYENMMIASARKDTQDQIDSLKKTVDQYKGSGDTAGIYEVPTLLAQIKALEDRQKHLRDYVFNPNYSDKAGAGIFASQVATIGDPLKLQKTQTDVTQNIAKGIAELNQRLHAAGLETTPSS